MASINCAHCRNKHTSVLQVKDCAFRHARAAAQSQRLANMRASVPQPIQARPNEWPFKTPEAMVRNTRDGRYAVELDGKWTFLRFSRPKNGKRKGCLVVQTQHSEAYKPFVTFYPSGSLFIAQNKSILDAALMMVAADPFTSAMNYGRELGCCSRCGRELTDERSRYYSIGPECEKYWPEIINYINETKGVFFA